MKRAYKYIAASVICLVSFIACDDSKLELVSPNLAPNETFLSTPAQAESAVNAIYANLQTRGLYSRHWFFSMDLMGYDADGNSQLESDKRQYLEFKFDASHGAIRAMWESCYRGINKANFVIDSEEKIGQIPADQMSQKLKDKLQGEAKFMRAFYYFILASRFGDVPLITKVPTTGDGTPKSTRSEVYQQIYSDLQDAITKLVTKDDAIHEDGRATKGAAYALLGKAYLFEGKHQEAKDAFMNIVDKDYSLVDEYYDNFMEETEFNKESIFEVQEQEDLGTGAVWNSDASGIGLNESTFRGQEYGWNNWFNVYPSTNLLSEYETGDPRYDDSFYTEGDRFEGGGNKYIKTGAIPSDPPPPDTVIYIPSERVAGWRKYQNYYKEENENIHSSINFRVIRYADVLLMLAECENELDNPTEAINRLNEVRNRASVSMPNYGTPTMDLIYPVSTKQEIFDAIVHERRVEFAGEQIRFPDLVRWGLAEQEVGANGFIVGKHEVFPIPQNEINSNNALTNADQNPKY